MILKYLILLLYFCELFVQIKMAESNDPNSNEQTCTAKGNCEILYDREKYVEKSNNLDEKLWSLMRETLLKVDEIDPVINYILKKVAEYQTQRRYDKVTLVGSLGNKLYFPEPLSEWSFQVEADVLYERPIQPLTIPVTNEQSNPNCPTAELEVDTLNDTLPMGTVLLKVKAIHGELSDFDKRTYFKEIDKELYLSSATYRGFVLHIYDLSILGEKEVGTFAAPVLQPLYRTYKTGKKTLVIDGIKTSFTILMDKVAAVKIPWPDSAEKFKNRVRKWPPGEIVNRIIDEGCLLIHKPVNKDKTYMLEWRQTFSTAEQIIALNFSKYQRAFFLILKQIKRKYFDFGTFESGESKVGLTTYHLKTLILWLSESISQEEWEKLPGDCFFLFFKELEKALDNNFLSHYFIPEINVFASAWEHKHLQMSEFDWLHMNQPMRLMLLEKVREIQHNPSNFLVAGLLEAIDQKHVHESEKEPVVEDYFGDLVQVIKDREEGIENDVEVNYDKIFKMLKDDDDENDK